MVKGKMIAPSHLLYATLYVDDTEQLRQSGSALALPKGAPIIYRHLKSCKQLNGQGHAPEANIPEGRTGLERKSSLHSSLDLGARYVEQSARVRRVFADLVKVEQRLASVLLEVVLLFGKQAGLELLEGGEDLELLRCQLILGEPANLGVPLQLRQALAQLVWLLLGEHPDHLGRPESVANGRLYGELHAAQLVHESHVSGHDLGQRLLKLAQLF